MKQENLYFKAHARALILRGIEKIVRSVKITLGPKGRNVLIGKENQKPLITNDGVTIAKSITINDKLENIGAEVIKQASIKTNDNAGDGTTTSTILAQAIIKQGFKCLKQGFNPVHLIKGIEKATDHVVACLNEQAIQINNSHKIKEVATISSGSAEIGSLIAQAYEKVGKNGLIVTADASSLETTLSVNSGLEFDRGYVSPYMVTNEISQNAELLNCYVLITNHKINNLSEIYQVLEEISKQNKPLLLIADTIEQDAITGLLLNKMHNTFTAVAVKTPSIGEDKIEILKDIACITGGRFIDSKLEKLTEVTIEMLGTAKKIIVNKSSTKIIDGNGNKKEVEKRVKEILSRLKNKNSSYERNTLKNRLAKLCGGVATINIGAASEIELTEKRLRIEDALSATKIATAEGIVPGGGVALIKCYESLNQLIEGFVKEEKKGAKIILSVLDAPLKQILKNAAIKSDTIIKIIKNSEANSNLGYDALNGAFCDMYNSGIIDPAAVTKNALINAVSVAKTLLTTDCLYIKN